MRTLTRDVLGRPGSSVREKFVGTWKLVSIEIRSAGGRVRNSPVLGPDARGILIYSPDGYMCAHLMNPDLARFHHATRPAVHEMVAAYRGFIAYSGRWEVDEDEGVVLHYTELDRVPNEVGTVRKRLFEFSGNRLKLTPPPATRNGRETSTMTLTWERVTS